MMSEKIRLVLAKRDKSKAWLAEQLNCSTSNLYNKLKRDNFSEKSLWKLQRYLTVLMKHISHSTIQTKNSKRRERHNRTAERN